MKKIFLVWPVRVSVQSSLYPPLGLAFLASRMKHLGYDVNVIDLAFDKKWEQLHALKEQGGIYGISLTTSLYDNTIKAIDIIRTRDKGARIILGGPHPSIMYKDILNQLNVSVVCIGESEISFPLAVDVLINGKDMAKINGIAYKDSSDNIIINYKNKFIDNLDSLPYPDQSFFPYEQYFKAKGFRELSMITSRGCPYSCVFCQPLIANMFGKKFRCNSIDYIINQMKFLKKMFKLDFIAISDDTFTFDKKRVEKLCLKIISEKINIFWRCQTRINSLDRNLIKLLKKAGCFIVALGVESGNQNILNSLGKNTKIEKIKEVFKICHEEGMLTHAFLMIGNKEDNVDTINDTKNLIKQINPFSYNVSITTPYPGTYLYDDLECKNDNWSKYDHLVLDTINIDNSCFSAEQLAKIKEDILNLQRPLLKIKYLFKAFFNISTIRRIIYACFSDPSIIVRCGRLIFLSIFKNILKVSNPNGRV